MDIIRLYQDYSVPHATEGHKHCRPGWVNTACPFCTGNVGVHLGWNLQDEYYKCWRCGWHSPVNTIMALLHIPIDEAYHLVKQYGINRTVIQAKPRKRGVFKFPSGVERLNTQARNYLNNRGFNASELKRQWKLKSLGPLSTLEKGYYKHRILIPYIWNGQTVSFDTRDITEKQKDKYKACPKHLERIERKKILYGNQEQWGETGICVEGPTDVWRFGVNSFAVSGINYTPAQVRLIAQIFERVFIVFDTEPTAQKAARKLRAELRLRGVTAQIVALPNGGDPGEMKQTDADEFVNKLIG